MQAEKKQMLILSGLLFISYFVVMNKWGHIGDMQYWMEWSKYMYVHGLTNAYDPENGCDYLPGFLYILWFNTKIQHTATNVQDNLYMFKFFVLAFDFVCAYLAVYFVKDASRKLFGYLFILCNVAFIFNTIVWSQVDAIFTCFGFAAILAALNRKMIWSCILLVIALNFKLQALVFIPIVGLLLLPQYLERFSVGLTLKIVMAIGLTQLLMVFPFLIKGKIDGVWNVVAHSVDHYPYISMAAFNFWFLAIPGDVEHHVQFLDSGLFFGLTYKSWGYLLFFSFLALVVFPLVRFLYAAYIKKAPVVFPLEKVFLVSALIATGFFYFNTQMHERYFHPALISLAAYTFLSGNYFPFVLGSVAYFINMERIIQSLALTNYKTLIFQPVFVSILFALLIFYLLYRLYSERRFNEQNIQLTT